MSDEVKRKLDQHLVSLRFTKRIRQIAYSVCCGLSNQEIANEYDITIKTTKNYVTLVYKKLKVKNRSQLICKVYHQIVTKLMDTKLSEGNNGNI
jgi:DNA-binding NarL/FixJ family response regulator